MSDTYDEMYAEVERVKRMSEGGRTTHNSADVPDQDFGKFSKMGEERLAENSPEHYEESGDCGDEYKRHLPEREILRP